MLLARPLTLLRFKAPEYSIDDGHGNVRWLIQGGLLVARAGRGCGFLSLDVRRVPDDVSRPDATLHIQVEVANFYPAIAAGFSTPGVRGHAVGDPRAGHARVPALAGSPGPGRARRSAGCRRYRAPAQPEAEPAGRSAVALARERA